jgi:hypothetical protein
MKVHIATALVLMCISTLQATGGVTGPFVLPYTFVSLNLQQDVPTNLNCSFCEVTGACCRTYTSVVLSCIKTASIKQA